MRAELAAKLLFQGNDLCVAAAKHGHQRTYHLTVGALDPRRRGQLGRRQRVMDRHHPRLQVPPSPSGD
jgi:hypothetical protein